MKRVGIDYVKRDPEKFIRAAKKIYEDEGVIEVDADADISDNETGEAGGCYVQAWVWVRDDEVDNA